MKLRQREYCHNCGKYVDFEFDDVTDKQVIYCPECGHEHYRELDSGTLLNIQMDMREFQGQREIRICMPADNCTWEADPKIPSKMNYDVRTIKGVVNGNVVVESRDGDENKIASISERRWGRDPRQAG